MYKVKIFSVGRNKEDYLSFAIEEYTKRLKSILSIEWIYPKDNKHLEAQLQKNEYYICLDSQGILLTSEEFSSFLKKQFIKNDCRLSFVIGGSEGIPSNLKQKSQTILSLSLLTFPHQMVRYIFVEQLYRAIEIDKGSPYHK